MSHPPATAAVVHTCLRWDLASWGDMETSKGGKTSTIDMISNLPDHVLLLILSRITSTKEVIRTSILSIRWRHLWTSVPSIDMDCFKGSKTHKEYKKHKFKELVNRILANKSINLDSFRICCGFCNMSTMGQWIDAAVERNVKLLDLSFFLYKTYEDFELPYCLVTCGSLEVLKLSLFSQRLRLPKFTGFPALRVLELKSCKLIKGNIVKDFLKSCPLLEDLSLVECVAYNFDLICIACPKLKKLRIDNRKIEGMCDRLEICCPKLAYLEFAGFMAFDINFESLQSLKKVAIHPLDYYEWAPNNVCEFFAGFFHAESLSLCMNLIQKLYHNLEDLPEISLPNLKTLELTSTTDSYSMFILTRIFSRFSNLESLHLIIQKDEFSTEEDDLELCKMDCGCIFERLKMVNMRGVTDAPCHMIFIKFLLKTAPCLETMSISLSVNMTTDRKLSFTIDLLRSQQASPEAEIIFVQDQV